MIYDRTEYDVTQAKKIILEKVQKFSELSAKDIATLERGTLTINTLNRIENKQKELKTKLNNIGFQNIDITNKTWTYSDIFYETDFIRLLDNMTELINAFYVMEDTPNVPEVRFHYETINALEKILYDIEYLINISKKNYRKCGTFKSGEVFLID